MIHKFKEFVKKSKYAQKIYYYLKPFMLLFKRPIKGSNNKIVNQSKYSKIRYDIIGNNNSIQIMAGAYIEYMYVFVRGNNHNIKIGKDCIIKNCDIWMEDDSCKLQIGDFTTIEEAHFGITEPNSHVIIGEDCMFSSGIKILTGDSHSIIDVISNKRINYAENVMISNHVWVGADVIILKGAAIAAGSIVATRAVVTKQFTDMGIILSGLPAKILRYNVTWDRKRTYL